MRTRFSRKVVPAVMMAGATFLLAACDPPILIPGDAPYRSPDEITTPAAVPTGAFGTAPLVDQSGRAWQPRVGRSYVSATGHACSTVALTPAGAGMAVQRVACLQDGAWTIVVPLALAPGEADPRFAPIADPTAPATPSTQTAPFQQRSAS